MPTRQNLATVLQGIGAGLNPALQPVFLNEIRTRKEEERRRLEEQQKPLEEAKARQAAIDKLLLQNFDKFSPEAQDKIRVRLKDNLGINPGILEFKTPEANDPLRRLAQLDAKSASKGLTPSEVREFQMLSENRQLSIQKQKAELVPTRIERDRNRLNQLSEIQNRTPAQERLYQQLSRQVARDSAIVGRTEFDVGFTKSTQSDLQKGLIKSQQAMFRVESLKQALQENPNAVGFIGGARVKAADFIETMRQVGIPISESVSKTIAPDSLIDTRGQIKLLTGTLVPLVTGDTSGRYSDFDMQQALAINTAAQNVTSTRSAIVLLDRLHQILQNGVNNAKLMLQTNRPLNELVDQGIVNPGEQTTYSPINQPYPKVRSQDEVDNLASGTKFMWFDQEHPQGILLEKE